MQVMPGEVDTYCAEDIWQNGGIVLTSVSNLPMEDLCPHGSVAFFWEIGTTEDNMKEKDILDAIIVSRPDRHLVRISHTLLR
ncbi:hypothetical protein PG984_016023 [Apiospora sp. TS-2023a]